jgi:hypothetical protein
MAAIGIGQPTRELLLGSTLLQRLAAAGAPARTKVLTIFSRADALVPATRQLDVPGADRIVYDDLGHVSLLGSARVAREITERLGRAG